MVAYCDVKQFIFKIKNCTEKKKIWILHAFNPNTYKIMYFVFQYISCVIFLSVDICFLLSLSFGINIIIFDDQAANILNRPIKNGAIYRI